MINNVVGAAALVGELTGDHRLILDPAAPLESVRELLRRCYSCESLPILRHQTGVFFEWRGTHYAEVADEHIRAVICRFLDGAWCFEDKNLVPFSPKPRDVADVLSMLRTEVQLQPEIRPPAWLDRYTGLPPREFFNCANGLVHLPTGMLYRHTPALFGLNAVNYAFDPGAMPREWLVFLDSIWPDDEASKTTLQELFGYLLTADTALQKAFLIVGPPRSGKGTIARVLRALLGAENVVGPTLASLTSSFGLMPLIGKPLAVISDARLSGRADQAAIVERFLSITGEDSLTIDRKYREPWTGQLPTRLLILSNEIPRLGDASRAFPSRLIVLKLRLSFLDQEDHVLTPKLLQECPAILNWAIQGLRRLTTRGRFVQPESARQEIEILTDLASPIGAFLRDCCIIGPGQRVPSDTLYSAWTIWCGQQGREHSGNKQTFGRDLRAALPALKSTKPRVGARTREVWYEGIALAAEAAGAGGGVAG